MKDRSRRWLRNLLIFLGFGMLSCVLLGLVGYLSNQNLPSDTISTVRLDPLDKARLAETLHLKAELGEEVWPGWGDSDIPILVWNRENAFLTGVAGPPPGWQQVPGDSFNGQPYYRNPEIDPENFAMFIGDQWVTSMATKDETDLFMQSVFREVIPDFLEPFFPFRVLILDSELQISAVLHESFHVYQARQAPDKFARAEAAYQNEDRYWDLDPAMNEDWETEMDLLIEAQRADSRDQSLELARQFLAQRDQRRDDHSLPPALVTYEQEIEWLEGLAKYTELMSWREASATSDYEPLPEMEADPDFENYQTYSRRWDQEIAQARRQATLEGDVRFYYSGMLQGRLLDRLLPEWKSRILAEDVYLEDLLREAVMP